MSEPDLFDNLGATNTDGYDRWHAERLAEPRVGPQQPELAVGVDEAGYSAWKNEVGEEQIAFEKQWGVTLGKSVRVQFKGLPKPMEGVLRAVEEKGGGRPRRLRLQMGEQIFLSYQIESLVRL